MTSALLLLTFFGAVALSSAQFYYHHHQPVALGLSSRQYQISTAAPAFKPISEPSMEGYAHPSVAANSELESNLPPELSKSARFYSNPHIAAALAKESWFTSQEMPVIDREAEKIPRDQVYKIFKSAGWATRR